MATEKVVFKKGLLANLPAAKAAGTIYVTTDERAMYLDVDASTRVRIGDFQEFATLTALQANTNPSTTALYYVADVNVLAKWDGSKYVQINLDTGATSVAKTGSGNALAGVSYDPATRKLTFTTVELPTADDVDAAIAAAKKAGDDAQTDVDTLAGKVGTVTEGKTVVQMIEDAKTAATYDDTDIKARVATLEGEDAGKSTRAIAAEETAKIVAGADVSFDTLKEVADWISGHKTDAAAMNSAILALESILAGIGGEGEKATVVAYVTDAIAALKIGDYAKAADLTALAARVTAAEGKINTLTGADTVEGSVAKVLKDAKGYADEKNAAMDTRMKVVEGKAHEHSNKTVLDGITAAKVSAWDAAEQNAKDYSDGLADNYDASGAAATALNDAKTYVDSALSWGTF